MPALLDKFVDRMLLWSIRGSETGRFETIGLADLRGRGDSFCTIIQSSLRLIQEEDPRRYARVKQHIAWVVNQVNNALGAEYHSRIHALFLQFDDLRDLPPSVVTAFYACIIVHEATHGMIAARGIKTSEANKMQIERACTLEQNRFAAKLSARDPERYPAPLLHFDAEESYWAPEWKKTGGERARSFIKRLLLDRGSG